MHCKKRPWLTARYYCTYSTPYVTGVRRSGPGFVRWAEERSSRVRETPGGSTARIIALLIKLLKGLRGRVSPLSARHVLCAAWKPCKVAWIIPPPPPSFLLGGGWKGGVGERRSLDTKIFYGGECSIWVDG